jgi:ABC-type nitrate/sulfonate/bicarbonate transport system permease component
MWSRLTRALVPIFSVVLLFVVWDLIVRLFHIPQFIMPTPGEAINAIRADGDTLRDLTLITLEETVYGFILGAVVGFVLAIVMGQIPILQRLLYPVLITSQAVPIVAIAAPLVIILGFGMKPKLVIVALIVFFPVVVNVVDGLAHIDRDLINLARAVGGKPLRVFFLIRLPATVTPLFSALKIGATYAVTGAVIGEWTASTTSGLGNYLQTANSQLNTAAVYGVTLLLTAIGIFSFLSILALERLATPWRTRSTARRFPWRSRVGREGGSRSEDMTGPAPATAELRTHIPEGGKR